MVKTDSLGNDTIVGIKDVAVPESCSLQIYPNPVSSNQSLVIGYRLPEGVKEGEIRIYGNKVRVVREINVYGDQGTTEINLQQLTSGIYIVTLSTESNIVDRKKIILIT